ncbi:MAG: hypothetical protein ACK4E0_02895 [Chitinophagaceae bacterium]
MWPFITSLSFLYTLTGLAVLWFAFFQYRDFKAGRVRKWRFIALFVTISVACLSFLWIHFHAPLSLRTYSNLEHHFLEHSGFIVKKKMMLGGADTANMASAPYNEFWLEPKGDQLAVRSTYQEEPAYAGRAGEFQLLSKSYPAIGHRFGLVRGNLKLEIKCLSDDQFELLLNNASFSRQQLIRRGIRVWDLFRSDSSFANEAWINDLAVSDALRHTYILRNEIGKEGKGALVFFGSDKLIKNGFQLTIDGTPISQSDLHFSKDLEAGDFFAWGISFPDNNRNQFRVARTGQRWQLLHRYPTSYPLSEDGGMKDGPHTVTKFLISDGDQLKHFSGIFREGFLFSAPDNRQQTGFVSLLLQYQMGRHDEPLQLKTSLFGQQGAGRTWRGDSLVLASQDGAIDWIFRVRNSFDWQLGGSTWSQGKWQLFIFGSLFFFIAIVVLNSILSRPDQQNMVTQILAGIVLVFLTTRFFLYWRYKSFPPFEGLDLPSEQQLNSSGNFLVIVAATLGLSLIFGTRIWEWIRQKAGLRQLQLFSDRQSGRLAATNTGWTRLLERPLTFFAAWFGLLGSAAVISILGGSAGAVNRHLAIVLIIFYFVFLYWSYRFSPLMADQQRAWWKLKTHRWSQMIISNPVKVLLSLSLLALFGWIDIGFAIVFLNFLLFHEAFLCINYAIGGLSAGSSRNARAMAWLGGIYLTLFVLNLLFAPYLFGFLLQMPDWLYIVLFAFGGAFLVLIGIRLQPFQTKSSWKWVLLVSAIFSLVAMFVFPKEKLLEKAASTQYRINVLTQPVDEALTAAYSRGANYVPVIRAAQNQWFINTFVEGAHNPAADGVAFRLLPHSPQSKGARYNAQATDLVSSRFLLGEHGRAAIFLYVCLLLLPAIVLGSFYQLYPDFTNRINRSYATATAGFAILNYLLVTALMVVLAATGRYIFFGQDLPFASILSKQSIIFPVALLILLLLLFRSLQAERFANRRKWLPGISVMLLLFVLLFFVQPPFNRQKEFTVPGLANSLETFVATRLQPLLDHFDTAAATRRLPVVQKDRLFCDSLRKSMQQLRMVGDNPFFWREAEQYAYSGYSRHRDQRKLLFLDPNANGLKLAVNDRFFQVEPPPHLQTLWKGDVVGDTSVINLVVWNAGNNREISRRVDRRVATSDPVSLGGLTISFGDSRNNGHALLTNTGTVDLVLRSDDFSGTLKAGESIPLFNETVWEYGRQGENLHGWIGLHPDAFMRNFLVNGSRYYFYPLGERFIWARNFAEATSVDFAKLGRLTESAIVSLDYTWTDSLTAMMEELMDANGAFGKHAGYAITVADAEGRLLAMADYVKGSNRVSPNDKAAFMHLMMDDDAVMMPSDWRRQLGNLNLLRMNPGPGSTLKPIVFPAIASQLAMDWNQFSSTGFSEKQKFFGGMKVPEYDFELNNGRISTVADYIRLSDNYYHANLLLLGSYRKQSIERILDEKFQSKPGVNGFWPRLDYRGKTWYMHDFRNWPNYDQGQVDFGADSSFVSIGLLQNFGMSTDPAKAAPPVFNSSYDRSLLGTVARQSGFVLPEWSLFDQRGLGIDHRIPYDLFLHCFRGHVKGSSQVLISPVGMVNALGKLVSQDLGYSLSLNPNPSDSDFRPFHLDAGVNYNEYLDLMRTEVFAGMRSVLERGTAAGLGKQLKQGGPYYYFAKTGTTGDDEKRTKSKLMALIISSSDLSSPDHVFRNNPFLVVYFTCQDGPAQQQEEFQARVIRYLESSQTFRRYMTKGKD